MELPDRSHEERAMRVKVKWARRTDLAANTYQLTDLLHNGRTMRVSAEGIVDTISDWLAELGVASPLVDELARTVRDDDWPAAHDIARRLSVDVSIAA
jgi:hypothetical protein